MMSPYPGSVPAHDPEPQHDASYSNGHGDGVASYKGHDLNGNGNGEGVGPVIGEFNPYNNPRALGSYNWRSDEYQDQTVVLNEKRKAALEEVDKPHFSCVFCIFLVDLLD